MSQLKPKPFNVLDKAKSESYSDKDAKTFNRVEKRMAKMNQARLVGKMASFRREGADMTPVQLFNEKHSSSLLGKHLRTSGIARPEAKWEAHHLISGKHPEAMSARLTLAEEDNKIRIDDPDNGAWMPKTKTDARPTIYPNAIGHNRIHRHLYYFWIENTISMMDDDLQIRSFLNRVRAQLLQGNIRDEMILQAEIDEAEYKDWLKKNRKL
ncbi:MAG: AHH domain-containing protein [Pseudomonadota bacterium]